MTSNLSEKHYHDYNAMYRRLSTFLHISDTDHESAMKAAEECSTRARQHADKAQALLEKLEAENHLRDQYEKSAAMLASIGDTTELASVADRSRRS